MKKLLFCALAAASFAACSNDDTVEVISHNSAIAFDNAFVDNATRAVDPSTTTSDATTGITAFDVYAFMDNVDGVVFDKEKVSRTDVNSPWTYVNTQYWAPKHTYYFAALAPVDGYTLTKAATTDEAKNGVGTVAFENKDGKADLLYAAADPVVQGDAVVANPVAFTFNHLLSKVMFSFKNGFDNANATISVKNIKMVVPAKGSINLAQEDWWSTNQWVLGEGTTTLEFGNMVAKEATAENADAIKVAMGAEAYSNYERLTIPAGADQKYEVTFDVELYMGEQLAYSNTLKTTIEGAALEIGKAYNFKATLDASNISEEELKPIEFTVTEVKDWVDAEYDGGVIETAAPVATAEALTAAVAAGGNYILTEDITTAERLNIPAGVTTSIDLNGYTLTATGNYAVVNNGNLTLSNGSVEGAAIWNYETTPEATPAVLTLNNVNVTSPSNAIVAWSYDYETIPSATTTASTKLIINGGTIKSTATDQYAIKTIGYNDVAITDAKVEGVAGAASIESSKAVLKNSSFTATGAWHALHLFCSVVSYDADCTFSAEAAEVFVQVVSQTDATITYNSVLNGTTYTADWSGDVTE